MVGFVGLNARRRRRNRILLVVSIIAIFGIFFYLPSIDFSTDQIEPPIEIISKNLFLLLLLACKPTKPTILAL